jgi:uncharacterized membrane protein YhaH (DUF805 family)
MLDYALMPLRRYADFNGRSRRKEYWSYTLLIIAAVIVLSLIEGVLGMSGMVAGVYGPLTMLLLLGTLVPSLAAGVRRLHDQDKSGWWMLLGLVPLAGLVLLVFFLLEGTRGENRFGPDPKAT